MDEIHWINKRSGSYRCLRCGFQYLASEHGSPARHLKCCGVAGRGAEAVMRQCRIVRMILCALEEVVNRGDHSLTLKKFVGIVLQYGGKAIPHLNSEEVERVMNAPLGDIASSYVK